MATVMDLDTSIEPDSYLSDGSRLFRVVRGFGWPPDDSWAVLEDCRTLEHHTFTPDELWALRLESVEPASRC